MTFPLSTPLPVIDAACAEAWAAIQTQPSGSPERKALIQAYQALNHRRALIKRIARLGAQLA